jgi:hypothetical protein
VGEKRLESYRLGTAVLFFASQTRKKLSQLFKSSRKLHWSFLLVQNKKPLTRFLFGGRTVWLSELLKYKSDIKISEMELEVLLK